MASHEKWEVFIRKCKCLVDAMKELDPLIADATTEAKALYVAELKRKFSHAADQIRLQKQDRVQDDNVCVDLLSAWRPVRDEEVQWAESEKSYVEAIAERVLLHLLAVVGDVDAGHGERPPI